MKTLVSLSILFCLSGCAVSTLYQAVRVDVDEFTGQTRRQTDMNCGQNFCSQFLNVSSADGSSHNSTALLGYTGDDWLFVEEMYLKVEGDEDFLLFTGRPDRKVLEGGNVREIMKIPMSAPLRSLMQRALGKTVIVRFKGKSNFIDRRSQIGIDGQWGQFLAAEVQ